MEESGVNFFETMRQDFALIRARALWIYSSGFYAFVEVRVVGACV